MEDVACGQQVPEEVPETPAASKGEDAVAKVRKEVDKLEQQVNLISLLYFTFSFCSFLFIFLCILVRPLSEMTFHRLILGFCAASCYRQWEKG